LGDSVHELTREQARRIAVRAQLLDAERPTDLLDIVRHLTAIQYDVTTFVAPSAELVAWSRLGPAYDADELTDLVDTQAVLELEMRYRPAEDLVLHRAEMADWPGDLSVEWRAEQADWVAANDASRRDILDALRRDGPLPVSELPDTCEVPWRSSGWTNNKNRSQLVKLMGRRGEIAIARREGREPLWDLAERIFPDEPVVPLEEAYRIRAERLLRAMGVMRERTGFSSDESFATITAGEPATIEGVRGKWRVDPAYLDGGFRGRAAILSPLDRLVYDRKRTTELFEFDYQLEMYKPAAKRQWGYWAMPVLYGDRLVGKLDAQADRSAGVLRVDALHRDVEFSATMERAVEREIAALADALGLEFVRAEGS
jgi:uncharacterized protein